MGSRKYIFLSISQLSPSSTLSFKVSSISSRKWGEVEKEERERKGWKKFQFSFWGIYASCFGENFGEN